MIIDNHGRWAITDVRAVTPDGIVENATVVAEPDADGVQRIVDLTNGPAPRGAVPGHGLLLLPGLVDSHSDGLEKEISPRRTAHFPYEFALGSFEGRVRAAGTTTMYHGVGYQEKERSNRSIDKARQIESLIVERNADPARGLDHRVLFRFEARDALALEPLLEDLSVLCLDDPVAVRPVVSFEDHTPGQGQYRDPAKFRAAVDPEDLPPGETVDSYVERVMAEAAALASVRDANIEALSTLARDGSITLLAHDLETPEEVEIAASWGATVAEFPLALETARAAHERGFATVMGAPNAMRGSSHSGNVSARDLVAAGLCDVLASDYLPTTLLAAVFVLAENGVVDLATAVSLVSANPARMLGLHDRGRIEPGLRADLVLVDDRRPWPQVLGVRRADDRHHWRALAEGAAAVSASLS